MSNPNQPQPPPNGSEVERPIIFRWRRGDGTVLVEHIVNSRLAVSGLVPGEGLDQQRVDPDDVVEYRFPDGDWQPAVRTRLGAWTIREAT